MEKFDKALELLASMNADEFRKLQDLIAKTELVEENAQKEVEPPAEIKKNAEIWLTEQKKVQGSESYILHSIKKHHLNRIDNLSDKVDYLKLKIIRQQKKISNLNSAKQKAAKTLDKLNLRIEKLEVSKAFLNGVEKSDSVINSMISLNNRRYESCLKKIASVKESFTEIDGKISKCNAKIDKYNEKTKKAEEKISIHKYRVQHIRDFHRLHVPHELLSFYIAEKTNTDIVKLNEALNDPMALYSKKEINDGIPFIPPEMPDTEELTKLESPEISKNQVELYSEFNNIAEANMVETISEEKAYFKEISDEELSTLADNDIKVIAKPHPEKEHSYIIKATQSEFEKINEILKTPSKNAAITR